VLTEHLRFTVFTDTHGFALHMKLQPFRCRVSLAVHIAGRVHVGVVEWPMLAVEPARFRSHCVERGAVAGLVAKRPHYDARMTALADDEPPHPLDGRGLPLRQVAG